MSIKDYVKGKEMKYIHRFPYHISFVSRRSQITCNLSILFLILIIINLLFNSCSKEENPTNIEEDLCSYVSPTGYNIPNCSDVSATRSNIQYDQYGQVISFDFSITCTGSGKTYSGSISDVIYINGEVQSYNLIINGKQCSITVPPDTTDPGPPQISMDSPNRNEIVSGLITIVPFIMNPQLVIKVELYVDSQLHASSTDSPFILGWNTDVFDLGSHVLQLKAFDSKGRTGISDTLSLIVSAWAVGGTSTHMLRGVDFFDLNNGICAGGSSNPAVFWTTDGGENWTYHSTPTTHVFNDVAITKINSAIVVGYSGTILVTSDRGSNWSSLQSGTTSELSAIKFCDADNGWIVGKFGTVLRTRDKGETWLSLPASDAFCLLDVSFVDTLHGSAAGFHTNSFEPLLVTTSNGGITWEERSTGATDYLQGVFMRSIEKITAVGLSGNIVMSSDGGSTWASITCPVSSHLINVVFSDQENGIIVGQKKTVLHTSDGGMTWILRLIDCEQVVGFQSVCFVGFNNGWIVGGYGKILKTTRGG